MASAIGGVPASNFHGMSLGVHPSRRTSRIISPPPRNGGHGVEQLGSRPQHADAGGAEHLVAGEAVEVGAHGGDVGGQVRGELRAVDQQQRAGGVGRVGEPADRGEGAEHVGHGRDADQLHAVEQPVEVGEVERVVLGHRDHPDLDAPLLAQHQPRHEVGVVLELGEQDGVALVQVGPAPRVGDQVDRLGDVLGEDDLARARAPMNRATVPRAFSNRSVASAAMP